MVVDEEEDVEDACEVIMVLANGWVGDGGREGVCG